jgi:TolB protein
MIRRSSLISDRSPFVTILMPIAWAVCAASAIAQPRTASRHYKAGEQVFPAAWSKKGELLVTVVDGGRPTILLLTPSGSSGTIVRGPTSNSWAADLHPLGNEALVEAYENGISDLFRVELATGTVTRVTTTPWNEWHPSWSRDGRSIVFDSDSGGHAPRLAVLDVASRATTRPTPAGRAEQGGKWSPNGRLLAFHRHMGAPGDTNYDIFVLDLGSGRATQITNDAADTSSPAWSPDGRRLVFASNRGGSFDLYVACADGTNVTRLTTGAGDEKYPVWSPDGNRIAYQVHGDGVWTVDANPVAASQAPAACHANGA